MVASVSQGLAGMSRQPGRRDEPTTSFTRTLGAAYFIACRESLFCLGHKLGLGEPMLVRELAAAPTLGRSQIQSPQPAQGEASPLPMQM